MSRASRRRDERRGSGRSQATFNKAPIFIMGGSVLAALLVVALVAGPRGGGSGQGHHPTPRADAAQLDMVPAARYAATPGIADVYRMAAEIPEVLDGIFCFCYCHDNFAHYSLLDCFRSDHGAGCDVCLQEAILAYQMTQGGSSLSQIRQAVDQQFSA